MHGKADRLKAVKAHPAASSKPELAHRLPPGQVWTERFPILHEGEVPQYEMSGWSLRIFGGGQEERTISYAELMKLPQTTLRCDIHCVTRWSKADTEWTGVRFRDLLVALDITPAAPYVMIHADPDYDTNVPLPDLMGDALLAHSYNGEPLTPKHGWPLRLVVPHLYFWKSAKWIRGIEFMEEDRTGFWERNGFHNTADPFREQRFSGEELPIPEDEWVHKDYD
ncbi:MULTISPECIES: sulfite oxidase-like oxidoreductase [Paenibacillus]|uniref:sulfite oxidase-like oxidoreductase n=1 Tax=Paenibacillus TaxID=44249 RepID=UPI0022B93D67|nr:sulfite oxidase-like oxidoreductase [Paenibacillus caseinilyticus]MCZ8521979.1 sulfite oxidase-like oxidoreductase [Paenibacillus caseinilyticus]